MLLSVLPLPFLALVILLLLLVYNNDRRVSKSFKSRSRRRIWLGYLFVVVLLLATVATLAWPVRGMSGLVQGFLITVLIMIPALVGHLLASLYFDSGENDSLIEADSDTKDEQASRSSESDQPKAVGEIKLVNDLESIFAISAADNQTSHPVEDRVSNVEQMSVSTASIHSAQPQGSDLKVARKIRTARAAQDLVSEVSDYVQSHDIGAERNEEDPATYADGEKLIRGIAKPIMWQPLTTSDQTKLKDMSSQQVSDFVRMLKEERSKLQKLVVAQHAVIESEREANIRNRGLARDAIKLMQGARDSQKMAQKMARRERSERRRLEHEYKKLSDTLNNSDEKGLS